MSEDRELLEDFLVEAGELTSGLGPALMALESDEDGQAINALFRTFHTLKGSAGFLGLDAIVKLCHAAEDLCSLLRGDAEPTADDIDALSAAIDILEEQMQALQDGADIPIAPAKVLSALKLCVATDRAQGSAASEPEEIDFEALLDAMHGVPEPAAPAEPEVPTEAVAVAVAEEADTNSEEPAQPDAEPAAAAEADEPAPAGEPAVAKAKAPVAESSIRVETQRLDTVMDLVGELVLVRNALLAAGQRDKSVATLDRVTADLQSAVMRIRMQPLTKLFSRFPRIVRDLARGLGKEIDLQLVGAETELDKNVVEALSDPLVHLVRNAVDHGIESPEARIQAGKSAQGRVVLSARTQGDHVLIHLQDDGAGMDPNRLRSRAIDRGLISGEAAATLDTQACLQLIFMPGFSTREVVSDVSGRGVGMDVVKTKIDMLGGDVHLVSEPGEGSLIELRLPLTLAILATLMVRVGPRIFALPLSAVDEVLRLDFSKLTQLDGRPVLMVDDEPLPVFDLGLWVPGRKAYGVEEDVSHSVILRSGQQRYAVVGARVCGREEVVIKPLDESLAQAAAFSGATVTGDGRIALVVDPAGLLKSGPVPPIFRAAA